MLRRAFNIVMSRWGWSFRGEALAVPRRVLYEDEDVILQCRVRNEGFRLGTAYVRFLIADAYTLEDLLAQASEKTDLQAAREMQQAKAELFELFNKPKRKQQA